MPISHRSVDPDRQRWMMFVDGENITARAQETAAAKRIELAEGTHYKRDTFIWSMQQLARTPLYNPSAALSFQQFAIRAYYYTGVVGSDEILAGVREQLWKLNFTPVVFRKSKSTGRSKGVDIALTKDMLSHAFHNHYDVAVLASGDGDYEPVIEEVKRLGKSVHVMAFESGLNDRLRLAADHFYALDNILGALPRVAITT